MDQRMIANAWREIENEAGTLRRAAHNRNQKELHKSIRSLQMFNSILQNFGMTWNLKRLLMVVIRDNEARFDPAMDQEECWSRSSKTTLGTVMDASDSDTELFPGFQANIKEIAEELDELIKKNGIGADVVYFLTLDDWASFHPPFAAAMERLLDQPRP